MAKSTTNTVLPYNILHEYKYILTKTRTYRESRAKSFDYQRSGLMGPDQWSSIALYAITMVLSCRPI
jgi:hypothetical protein